jgi:hypothetical protein
MLLGNSLTNVMQGFGWQIPICLVVVTSHYVYKMKLSDYVDSGISTSLILKELKRN